MAQERSKLATRPIYEIEISLNGIQPRIWRRIAISGNSRLSTLHLAIQAVMGWENYHLYEFVIDGIVYRQWDYAVDPEWAIEGEDSQAHQIRKVLKEGSRGRYLYDFGDDWEHEIVVFSVKAAEPDVRYPVSIAGEQACPPEDVGGVWGYFDFLEAVLDPGHKEHEEYLEWVGGKFDPNAFDVDKANQRLKEFI